MERRTKKRKRKSERGAEEGGTGLHTLAARSLDRDRDRDIGHSSIACLVWLLSSLSLLFVMTLVSPYYSAQRVWLLACLFA